MKTIRKLRFRKRPTPIQLPSRKRLKQSLRLWLHHWPSSQSQSMWLERLRLQERNPCWAALVTMPLGH